MEYSSLQDVLGRSEDHGEPSPISPAKPQLAVEDFKIVQMTIKDADDKGRILWQVKDWHMDDPDTEQTVEFPKEML